MEGCQNINNGCLWMARPRIIIDLSILCFVKKKKKKVTFHIFSIVFNYYI